jgi:ketosteroid isomerase-like protein
MSREEIDRARAEIAAGWLNSDPDAIMGHVTDDMFLGPHEPRVNGGPAIRAWLESFSHR